MAYQSLYRRYRPQRFSEIRGQQHIVSALQNAVAKSEVGHAYLFHGPRGTGKTTSARVLAKALNCENLSADSEPCGACESCLAIEEGRSFDLHELDAASNNGVDDMRELLGKVNLGNPGRAKVYILDEVHMLTRGAENALLKTLEEPPEHVIWVLATTELHKVVETIRSRCQVFELSLLGADVMSEHVRWIIDDAGLDVGEDGVEYVVTAGGGSARDTLSALDRVVAAGGVVEIDQSTDALLQAVARRDAAAALAAVGEATGRGREPRTIGEAALTGLRDAFLTEMGSPPPRITQSDQERADSIAAQMSPAQLTRALETLGVALVEMRQAPDPRIDLEVALVRLCRPETDRSVDSLVERIQHLEAQLAQGAGSPSPAPPPTQTPSPSPATQTTSTPPVPVLQPPVAPTASVEERPRKAGKGPAAAARQALAGHRAERADDGPSIPAPDLPEPGEAATSRGLADEPEAAPTAGSLRLLVPVTPREVVELAGAHLSLGSDTVVERANDLLGPTDGARSPDDLTRLWVALVDEFGSPNVADPDLAPPDDLDDIDLNELVDAPAHTDQVVDRLTEAFPGAELHIPEGEED